jgi:hypothetical protein
VEEERNIRWGGGEGRKIEIEKEFPKKRILF